MDEEIMEKFLTINNNTSNPTVGKYATINETFFEDIRKWQEVKNNRKYNILPIQFTFEITNKCNCNCKDCGMAANSIQTGKSNLNEAELIKLVDDLHENGIASFAVTGGEPFLEFDNMCKMLEYSKGKIDVIKIISNGFWGKDAKYYFEKMIKSGLLCNEFFIPSIQVSIGEQTVPLEYICNIIKHVSSNYLLEKVNLGIIHTRLNNIDESQLSKLYNLYLREYGDFPEGRVYLTDSYYVNANKNAKETIETYKMSVYDAIGECDNRFGLEVGKFVSPKIFMKCNGDCYPCEVFNMHKDLFLGNYFELGLPQILENLNNNKYVRFINKYGTAGFREVIPKEILEQNFCETSCFGCEFCIKLCEKNNLIR